MPQTDSAVLDAIPSTFLERGVAIPFTTPQLTGARIRPSPRHGLELVIPNPSGARGHYVLPIDMAATYCRMTVHDRALHRSVLATRLVTPAAIRRAARQIASEGLAGKNAAAAADALTRAEEHTRLLMNFTMLLELVEQTERAGVEAVRLNSAAPADVERRGRQAIAQVAPTLGCEPPDVHLALDEIAADLARIGRGPEADQAALPQMLARIAALRASVGRWAHPADRPCADLARLLIAVADATVAVARETLLEARAAGADVLALLRRRLTAPAPLATLLARPEWLLDGWDEIGALWNGPEPAGPPELRITEMVALLPLLPREAGSWVRMPPDLDAMGRQSGSVQLNIDWRSAMPVFEMIANNEHRRAMAA